MITSRHGSSASWIFGSGREPSESMNSPRAPGCPPRDPAGENRIRSTSAAMVHGSSERMPMRIAWPSPPRKRPAPAESGRSARSCTTSGERLSITSTGTPATPLGKLVLSRPSLLGRAPVPPADVWKNVNGSP